MHRGESIGGPCLHEVPPGWTKAGLSNRVEKKRAISLWVSLK